MNGPFVLAAGGTGGHLFPAQALAAELLARGRRVVVMTDGRGHNYGKAFPGAEIATVPAAAFAGRSPAGKLAALGIIVLGIATAYRKLKALKPKAVVGFGGYPSLPVMLAAILARIPSLLHEQNAVPGRVNRLLARRVKAIAATFPFQRLAPRCRRIVFTGNPVRPEAEALKAAAYASSVGNGPVRLLIFGGSQGARALSERVPEALALLPLSLRSRLEVTQQARAEDLPMVETALSKAGIKAEVRKFFTDLPERIAHAHLVIARAGASTLAELTAIGRPAILIPYPFATDDHQSANAKVLEKAGAALLVKQDALEPRSFARLLEEVLADGTRLSAMAEAARSIGRPDAAGRLADLAEGIAS